MTEEEAQRWLENRGWWKGTAGDRLRTFVDLVLDEADRQNLISNGSRDQIWARHIVDSAQLLTLPNISQTVDRRIWADLGTGAGFPGMVIGCLTDRPVTLIEARPLRVAFLRHCIAALDLSHVDVVGSKVEKTPLAAPAAIISARAYAPLDRLLASAHHLADENTIWLLPKGRGGEKELEIVRREWHAVFHVEQSITDPESVIVTVRQVRSIKSPPAHRRPTQRLQRFKRGSRT